MSAAQPARFLAVGAAGYAVNLLAFAALYAVAIPYGVASVVAYLVSNALMYVGNRYFTFGLGHEGFWGAYLRYVLVGLVVAGLTAGVLAFLVEVLELDATLGQAIALLVVMPVAFVLIKRWTFQLAPAGSV
ncbi:MAG: GtrA family protein [Gaiellaceae bacterium]